MTLDELEQAVTRLGHAVLNLTKANDLLCETQHKQVRKRKVLEQQVTNQQNTIAQMERRIAALETIMRKQEWVLPDQKRIAHDLDDNVIKLEHKKDDQ